MARKNPTQLTVEAHGQPDGNAQVADYDEFKFISAKALSLRWNCSRTQVYRIAIREGIARYCFGNGRNAMVRFLRKEVEDFENQRRV